MPRNNLRTLKRGRGKLAAAGRKQKSIPSKKVNSAKGITTNGSATPAKSAKNSTWARTLREHPDLAQLLDQAIVKQRSGHHQAAAAILQDALRRHSDQAPVLWYLGGIYLFDLEQPQKALALFRRATQISPKSERASRGLFHALWDLGRQREALKELKRFQSLCRSPDYEQILDEIRKKPQAF